MYLAVAFFNAVHVNGQLGEAAFKQFAESDAISQA
jgi:hypothetical protein